MKKVIFFVSIIIILSGHSHASSGSFKDCFYVTRDGISINIRGHISQGMNANLYSYGYSINNNSQSTQNVWLIDIILPGKNIIIGVGSPDDWGEPSWTGKPKKYSSRRELNPPYSIGWVAPEGKDIKPLEIVGGFAFSTTYGIPGIVNFYAEGYAPLPKCPEGMAEDFIPGYHDLTPYGPGIVGKTVGPTVPPADFKSLDFLDYIIDLRHQSASLGWITNPGIVKSLDAKLDNAKKKLESGNEEAAINILEAFINEVEAQGCETYDKCPSDKHLSPEAYALLKYNARYLIDHLR